MPPLLYNTVMMAGPSFDEVGPDGVRRIGNREGKPLRQTFTSRGQTYEGAEIVPAAPEQVIWTIRPDGTATLSRKYIPYRQEYLAASRNWSQYWGVAQPGMVIAFDGNAGGPFATYNFSREGLKVFRMAASLHPDGVVERGISINGTPWPAWDFPFTAEDKASMRQWVTSLAPAEAFGMYYTLLAYDGEKGNNCQFQKFVPNVSMPEFKANWFWPVFQAMVIQSIYDIRTDLHKVRDPDTGNVIDGLIKYDLFAMPCKPGIGEIIFGIIASVALGVVTAGAGAALSTALKTIDLAKSIYDMKNDADKARASAAFTNSVIKGYSAGMDIQNLLEPPPKLTPEEQRLISKAEGSPPSPEGKTPPPAPQAQGGAFPWWVVAGAAALLLS